jgi:site-specific DNA-methyltransferase (adenine-specific)
MSDIKLFNNDCIEIMDKLIEQGIKVDMIFTDPPYKVTSRGSAGNSGGMLQKKINRNGQVFKHNNIEIEDYLPKFYDVLKETGHCYIMTNHKNLTHFLSVIDTWKADDGGKFNFIKSLIWDKGNKIMGQYYMSQFEYILFLRKGAGVKINNCGTSDLLSIPNKKTKGEDGKNIHDTEKPVDLCKILIENSSKENETVLDPFMGVGGCGIAAKELNRNFIGIELDDNYFDIANKRIFS